MRTPALLALVGLPLWVVAQWTSVAGGVAAGGPTDLYWDQPSERLYATGSMTHMAQGDLLIRGITYYENGFWHAMGSGVYGDGFALSRYGDGVMLGGFFYHVDSTPNTWQLAFWHNEAWESVIDSGSEAEGGGLSKFNVLNNELHVLGAMNWDIGGSSANGWAVWDGTTWHQGDTTGFFDIGQLNQLCDYQGMRYVGGNFQQPGQPNDLVRWNGTAWEAVGGGIHGDPWVNELAEYDGKLWVAGEFVAAAGNAANALMTWDGQQWANPFPQISFTAQCKDMILANGKLYFAGPFLAQGLEGIHRLGVYDGTTLCVFGGTDILLVDNITASPDTFYADGLFTPGLGRITQWPLNAPMDTCYEVVQGLGETGPASELLRVFPNPTEGLIAFSGSSQLIRDIRTLLFTDPMGRTVLRSADGQTSGYAVDIRSLAHGTYAVTALDSQGRRVARTTVVKVE